MAVKAGYIDWNLLKAPDIYAKIGIGQIMWFFPDFRNRKEYNLGKKLKRERTWQKYFSKKRWSVSGKVYKQIWKKIDDLCKKV